MKALMMFLLVVLSSNLHAVVFDDLIDILAKKHSYQCSKAINSCVMIGSQQLRIYEDDDQKINFVGISGYNAYYPGELTDEPEALKKKCAYKLIATTLYNYLNLDAYTTLVENVSLTNKTHINFDLVDKENDFKFNINSRISFQMTKGDKVNMSCTFEGVNINKPNFMIRHGIPSVGLAYGAIKSYQFSENPTTGFEHVTKSQKFLLEARSALTREEKVDKIAQLKGMLGSQPFSSKLSKEQIQSNKKILAKLQALERQKAYTEMEKASLISFAENNLQIQLNKPMKWGRKIISKSMALFLIGIGIYDIVNDINEIKANEEGVKLKEPSHSSHSSPSRPAIL